MGWMVIGTASLLVLLVVTVAFRRRPDEVGRFITAREVTSRWASDPDSAPAPVRAIALDGARLNEPNR